MNLREERMKDITLPILTHSQGKINTINSEFHKRFGYSSSELIGRDPLEIIPANSWQTGVRHRIDTRDESSYYTLAKLKGGERIPVYLQTQEVKLADNQIETVVILREERDLPSGVSCEQRKEEMTRMIHELRTPMTSLLVGLRMMKLASSEERRELCYQMALKSCERELHLIDSFLMMQRLASGHHRLSIETLDLDAWLLALIEPFYPTLEDKGLQLSLDLIQESADLETDPSLLTRILQELIGNACKYTQLGGQILITVNRDDRGVTFEISNTATIPREALPHLFERFYRITEEAHEPSGSGLGLCLVQELVNFLQGEVRVRSVEGWSTFAVWLPHLALP